MNKNERTIEYMEEKSTLVGTRRRELIDADTGEVMKVDQITKLAYGSKHFWKCYMKEFLTVMKSLSGRQFDVFIYIVAHTKPSDNVFLGTYSKIVDDTRCCRQTVAAAMKKLQENDFIRKKQNGKHTTAPATVAANTKRPTRKIASIPSAFCLTKGMADAIMRFFTCLLRKAKTTEATPLPNPAINI